MPFVPYNPDDYADMHAFIRNYYQGMVAEHAQQSARRTPMKLGDFTVAVLQDIDDPQAKRFSLIVLLVLEAVIAEIVSLLFQKFINPLEAAQRFTEQYRQLGVWGRWQLARRVQTHLRQTAKLHRLSGIAAGPLATALAGNLARLQPADVLDLYQEVKLKRAP